MNNELTVNDYLDNLEQDRQGLITALRSKGVTVDNNVTFNDLIDKVNSIDLNAAVNQYITTTVPNTVNIGATTLPGYIKAIKTLPDLTLTGTSARRLFQDCTMDKIPNVTNMDQVTDASYMFIGATVAEIPKLNTPNLINANGMFRNCKGFTTVPSFDTSKCTDLSFLFYGDEDLTSLPAFNADSCQNITVILYLCSNLVNFGGLINLGKAYDATKGEKYSAYTFDLTATYSSNLSHDSIMNIINGLYDLTSINVPVQSLKLNAGLRAKLTDEEVAIATNKGWVVEVSS